MTDSEIRKAVASQIVNMIENSSIESISNEEILGIF